MNIDAKNTGIETRSFQSSLGIERRAASGDEPEAVFLSGHAAVFDKLSDNLGGFREKIDPGAFDSVMDDDVRALFNHDSNFVLGRTKAGTLKISQDKTGLRYKVELPDTQQARDLAQSVEREDINQSSFGFIVDEDHWAEDDEGRIVRTIRSFRELFDVSPVTFPAYPDTTVGKRSRDLYLKQVEDERKMNTTEERDLLKRKLRLLEL